MPPLRNDWGILGRLWVHAVGSVALCCGQAAVVSGVMWFCSVVHLGCGQQHAEEAGAFSFDLT